MNERFKLYGGEITLDFIRENNKHEYQIEERHVDGVTDILSVISKPALIPWAVKTDFDHAESQLQKETYSQDEIIDILKESKKAHTQKKDGASDFGTLVHNYISDYLMGKEPTAPLDSDEFKNAVRVFMDFMADTKAEFVESERAVYSKEFDYAGRLDLLLKINDKLCLADIKTSNNVYPEYLLQTAAYQRAYEEETGENINKRIIIHCDKHGDGITLSTGDYDDDIKAFLCALRLKRRLDLLKVALKQPNK